ncbi:LAMI_0B04808g1_1 [Lachancea mirantina]|uniref:LAMI_0B04808g1_1 n=1 Tax=Lachancea mirantina TaxID=1230905 RepID=A0A1G4IW29_9SACH|nr:LAMI_0B04808g1_1 [Lachancea mirantina]
MAPKRKPKNQITKPNYKLQRPGLLDSASIATVYRGLTRKIQKRTPLRNAQLFIPLSATLADIIDETQFSGLQTGVLQTRKTPDHEQAFLSFSNFNPLECAYVLSFLFYNGSRQCARDSKDHWTVPKGAHLRGSFYVYKSCDVSPETSTMKPKKSVLDSARAHYQINVSEVSDVAHFKEVYVSGLGLLDFMQATMELIERLRFRSCPSHLSELFGMKLAEKSSLAAVKINEIPFIAKGLLIDTSDVAKTNADVLEKSRVALNKFAQDLTSTELKSETPALADAKGTSARNAHDNQPNQRKHARTTNQNASNAIPRDTTSHRGNSPGFLSQEQINHYCIATIKASVDLVKTKSSYQILKTYIKYPRQFYLDLLYDNLDRMRASTNCNIVVLNLSNVHEAGPWLDSLNTSKYTEVKSSPHPNTTRVVSIGGIGEHIVQALQMLLELLNKDGS